MFVTGSADGLGRLTAETLLDAGHVVVVHVRNNDRLALLRQRRHQVITDLGDMPPRT